MTLVLSAWASRETRELGAQCSGEAKVSIERTGPHGTFAGDRTDLSDNKIVVTVTFQGTCWATGSIYFSGGAGAGSQNLPGGLKRVG
jgi:hypothetical protein